MTLHTTKICTFLSCAALYIVQAACHNHTETDTIKPTINVNLPLANDTIKLSTTPLKILLTCSDNNDLHTLNINITDSSNTQLFAANPNVHAKKTFDYENTVPLTNITKKTAITLNITAADHNENTQTTKIDFYVKP
jgi:hypothetical protein